MALVVRVKKEELLGFEKAREDLNYLQRVRSCSACESAAPARTSSRLTFLALSRASTRTRTSPTSSGSWRLWVAV